MRISHKHVAQEAFSYLRVDDLSLPHERRKIRKVSINILELDFSNHLFSTTKLT